ncbi:hypothetical protein SAMN02910343_01239 [Dialister histaminiformans]|uniref:Uncharacterized protein n=1 Tax=Allisonella histaminiformans TaxID=209880 RepID=A0A1G5WB22_9FIRM|nr:hypothetical protein SAMN02910343_01239 [Allisonella histaminiformans]
MYGCQSERESKGFSVCRLKSEREHAMFPFCGRQATVLYFFSGDG